MGLSLFFDIMKGSDPCRNSHCTEFEVDKNAISDFLVKKIVPIVGLSPFPLDELLLLVSAMCWTKPTHVFEWGTNIGKSARIFYETSKRFNIDCHIHSIDLPDEISHVEHPGWRRGQMVKGKQNVTLHQGDGLESSLKLLENITRECRPLFFLDGDHSYNSVHRELKGIFAAIPSPVILVHDTFYQSAEAAYNIGPYNAIMDTCGGPEFFLTFMNLGLPGMCLIRKKTEQSEV